MKYVKGTVEVASYWYERWNKQIITYHKIVRMWLCDGGGGDGGNWK